MKTVSQPPKLKVSDTLDYNTVSNAGEEMICQQRQKLTKNANGNVQTQTPIAVQDGETVSMTALEEMEKQLKKSQSRRM